MATIRDVARRAGVAISTVSFALNGTGPVSEETRRKVVEAAEAAGYVPNSLAQGLKRGHSKVVGLVLGDMSNPFFGTLLGHIDEAMNSTDHMLIVAQTALDVARETGALNQLRRHRVAGVLMAPLNSNPEFAAFLRAFDIPTVLIDQDVEGARLDFVQSDNVLATVMLTEYLIRLGHRRIGYVGGRLELSAGRLRLEGYRKAMATAGLELDPNLEVVADFLSNKAYEQVARLLSQPNRPTAIVAASNMMALGALKAIKDLGFDCPRDVSLTGVDDVPWGDVITPRITTVAQPVEELATTACRWLIERIDARGARTIQPRRHVAIPRLIVGTSCAPPSAS